MKFDMGRAWNDAVALLSANRDVVLIVGAVFFFLPYLALTLLLPDYMTAAGVSPTGDPADPSAALEEMSRVYGQIWWVVLLLIVLQGVGMLGLLALLTDRRRPTVAEALKFGVVCLVPYLLAQILWGLIVLAVIAVPLVAAASAAAVLAVLLGVVALVACLYLATKFSLISPVIAIDRVLNPIAALQRSWRLTKGNSLRLFVFYVLLVIVAMVVSLVIGLVAGLLGALGREGGVAVVAGALEALVNMAFVIVFLAVLAAVHRQLSGPSAEAISETFE